MSLHESLLVFDPPVHMNPFSTLHACVHPSPHSIFPSSHYSPTSLTPFPHVSLQVSFEVVEPPKHCHQNSIVQVDEQPSPLFVF
jgi:hypothetical protein